MTTSQSNRILAVVVSFVFILGMLTVALIVRAKQEVAPTLAERVAMTCEWVDVAEDTEPGSPTPEGMIGADMAGILHGAGWYGVAGDRAERLYAPACNVEVTESGSVHVWNVLGNEVKG